jgi:hypothetical protein
MSAALQFPSIARAAAAQRQWQADKYSQPRPPNETPPSPHEADRARFGPASTYCPGSPPSVSYLDLLDEEPQEKPLPPPTMAFYRKHTESLLRRYLYASILVARSPSIFTDPIVRGWASSRPVHTFEDCVIFVLDMEKALAQISALDRLLINRLVLQEYTLGETALLLNRSQRLVSLRLSDALDRLTRILLDSGTLDMPKPRSLHRDDEFVP